MNEEYLSVKDFAAACSCSTQYIYKILKKSLKPYTKKENKKTLISTAAVELVKNGFATDSTACNQPMQPNQYPTDIATDSTNQCNRAQPTNATACNQPDNAIEESGEVQALKELIKELKRDKEELQKDKEDLKKDKEDLKQEALKWQQLLIEERNKVKLLEATEEQRKEVVNLEEPAIVEEQQELPKTFGKKLKWLFKSTK